MITGLLLNKSHVLAAANIPQQIPDSVKGVVLDSYGQPLEGVKIIVTGSQKISFSNDDGNFVLNVPAKARLTFELKNFYSQSLIVQNNNWLVVNMQESYINQADTLDVLYDKSPADNIVASISTIYTNQLTTTPAPNYAYALAGRMAGLTAKQNSGFPSIDANSTIVPQIFTNVIIPVNGLNETTDNAEISLSIRGLTPVTIVDGVQRNFYSIDAEDIASISVLKDGLSTILLGQRSSNGVLLVTTKRAQAGPPRVSFTAQTGFQSPTVLPKPLPAYQYAYLYNEARENSGKPPLYTAADLQAYQDGSDPIGHPDVNWYNTILKKNSPITQYNLTIGGGSSLARYNVSLGYLNQDGLFNTSKANSYNTNDQLRRYLINTNVEVTPAKDLTINLQLFGRIQNGNQPGVTSDNIFGQLYSLPNNAYPVLNPNGSPGGNLMFQSNLYDQTINSGYVATYAKDIVADLSLHYKFDKWVPGLYSTVRGNFSVLTSNAVDRSKSNKVFRYNPADSSYSEFGSLTDIRNNFRLTSSAQYVYGQAIVGYDRQFNKSRVSGMLFTDVRSVTLNSDLPGTYRNFSIKADYSYDNKYLVEAAMNYSGYDRFAPGLRFGLFYGAGLGWKLSEEKFIKENIAWINFLKIRATYAKTGNDNVGYFIWRQSYIDATIYGYNFGANGSVTTYGTYYEDALANVNATWEKGRKFNIGFDARLFDNHWQATFDLFTNNYYDLSQQRGKNSALIGDTYTSENIGENNYKGAELTLTYQNHFDKLNYFITGNISLLSTKVIFMDEVYQPNPVNSRTGRPVGELFGYLADGLFQTKEEAINSPAISGYTPQPGDVRYRDIGGPGGKPDGVINQFDVAPITNKNPSIFYGTTVGFNYKGFDLSVLVQGIAHQTIYLSSISNLVFSNNAAVNTQNYDQILGRWTPETAGTATYPRLSDAANINNQALSSFWVRSGDYFRIKNIDIGYTLPNKWVSKMHLGSTRIFANALNLFTSAAYDPVDPEQPNGGVYPIQKVINFGINIKL